MNFFISLLLQSVLLFLPLIISGTLHMIAVKMDICSFLKIPISKKHFGANKTYRGLVLMIILTIPGVYISAWLEGKEIIETVGFLHTNRVILGAFLGLAYILSELPNSYFKRRIGIEPGQLPDKNQFLFALTDQADSVFGCMLVYILIMKISFSLFIFCIFLGTFIHLFMNVLLYLLGARKRPL